MEYQKSKIYKLVSNSSELVYYGSTTKTLKRRLSKHKSNYKMYLKGKGQYYSSFELMKLEDAQIILVEDFPCERKEDLLARERFYIENNICVNKEIPGRTMKEWHQDNKEILKQYYKQYQRDNRKKIAERQRKYYLSNREKISEQKKKYYQDNRARHKKTKIHQQLLSE